MCKWLTNIKIKYHDSEIELLFFSQLAGIRNYCILFSQQLLHLYLMDVTFNLLLPAKSKTALESCNVHLKWCL